MYIRNVLPALIILLSSCSTMENREKTKKIDSLLTQLDLFHDQCENIPADTLKLYGEEVRRNCDWFRSVAYNPVDAPRDKKDFDAYNFLDNAIPNTIESCYRIMQEIDFTKKQLNDLKRDIGTLSEEDFDRFYKDEARAVSAVKESVLMNERNAAHYIDIYQKLSPGIERIIDSVKQNTTD